MNTQLIEAYRYHRNCKLLAHHALARACADIAAGMRRYTCQFTWQDRGNINQPFAAYGHKRLRWIEQPAELWRFTGTSYDISRAEGFGRRNIPEGWYTRRDDCSETTSGVVYQLPARNGVPQYVVGYSDPDNDGPAVLSFDETFDDKMEAARAANRLAELMAEKSREHDEAWQAGNRFDYLGREVQELRRDLLATIQEAKAAAATLRGTFPKLCETVQASIRAGLAEVQKLRKERAKLQSEFGRHEGFLEGQS
jgi:hypothetical protein